MSDDEVNRVLHILDNAEALDAGVDDVLDSGWDSAVDAEVVDVVDAAAADAFAGGDATVAEDPLLHECQPCEDGESTPENPFGRVCPEGYWCTTNSGEEVCARLVDDAGVCPETTRERAGTGFCEPSAAPGVFGPCEFWLEMYWGE